MASLISIKYKALIHIVFGFCVSLTFATNICENSTTWDSAIQQQQIDNAFKTSKNDIIFLFQRSQGANVDMFQQQKKAMQNFITKYTLEGSIRITTDVNDTRVAMVSFGPAMTAAVEYNGITNNELTACQLEKTTNDMSFTQPEQITTFLQSLRTVKMIFEQGKTKRPNANRVLWIFFDGDDAEWLGDEISIVLNSIKRDENVKVFVAGIGGNGGALNSNNIKKRLISLATAAGYFSCVEHWLRIFQSPAMPFFDITKAKKEHYVDAKETCSSSCSGSEKCLCNIIAKKINCLDPADIPTPAPPTNPPNNVGGSGGTDPESGGPFVLPQWALIAIVVGAAALVLLIIIVTTVVVVRRTRAKRERDYYHYDGKIYEGPPIPPPPILKSKGDGTMHMMSDDVYSNPDHLGLNNNTGNVHINRESFYPTPDAIQEENMPGWPEHLNQRIESMGISHLCIYSTESNMWSTSKGFKLNKPELKELMRVFRQGMDYQGDKISINGRKFLLDPANHTDLSLRGTRTNSRAQQEVTWVFNVHEFIIVGVALLESDTDCEKTVYEMKHYVEEKLTSSYDEIGSGFDNPRVGI